MAARRALIVDDSRTAQVRLKKMLLKYQLEVDTAKSAEEALSYLSYQMPSVIFMDHLMEGMDGFEALKIIKSNPDTAMIPIIMYTSKSGDVYVGQARALGAIDVLSKDVIEPANIEKVLRGISILSQDKPAVAPVAAPIHEPVKAPVPMEEIPARIGQHRHVDLPENASDLTLVRQQVAKLMEINIAKIRQELADQNRFLFKRMVREFKEIKGFQQEIKMSTMQYTPTVEPVVVENERSWGTLLLELLIITVLAFVGYQVTDLSRLQEKSNQHIQGLEEQVELQLAAKSEQNTQGLALASDNQHTQQDLLAAIEWSLNLKNQFEYGQQALGDERLAIIQELVARLYEARFSGVVMLSVNFGDFCLNPTERGDFALPVADSALQSCQFLSEQVKTFSLQDQLSVSFVNFLISSPLLADEGIQIEMESNGYSRPRFSYPDPTVAAGEWNRIAGLNNRVEIALLANSKDS